MKTLKFFYKGINNFIVNLFGCQQKTFTTPTIKNKKKTKRVTIRRKVKKNSR